MIFTFIINSILVALAVLIHFEALNLLSIVIPQLKIKSRLCVLFGVFGALFAHIVEIWLFAFAYYFKIHSTYFGSLEGQFDNSLMDCSYFSFTTYTSLGIGDIKPIGDIRFMAGLEALTGLLLIAWTASFMFLEMQKLWKAP
ncbi:MAG: two pore domain potassium channel family protein [Methylococcaceae bacterium]|nr:two pore domain potassium channel family protein [Methylococcaceae bacterium]